MFDLTRQIVSDKQVWISVIHRYLENICTNWNQHRKLPTSMDWTCRVHKIYCKTGLCDKWENNNLLYYERLRSVKYTTTMKSILLFYCDSAQKIMLSILLKHWTLSSFAFFFSVDWFYGYFSMFLFPFLCQVFKEHVHGNEISFTCQWEWRGSSLRLANRLDSRPIRRLPHPRHHYHKRFLFPVLIILLVYYLWP